MKADRVVVTHHAIERYQQRIDSSFRGYTTVQSIIRSQVAESVRLPARIARQAGFETRTMRGGGKDAAFWLCPRAAWVMQSNRVISVYIVTLDDLAGFITWVLTGVWPCLPRDADAHARAAVSVRDTRKNGSAPSRRPPHGRISTHHGGSSTPLSVGDGWCSARPCHP